MLAIGFAELLIIGVVGLLVIGPERLPAAIRTGSAWLNRFRRGFNDLKREVQQELHEDSVMAELRKTSEQVRREADRWREDMGGGPGARGDGDARAAGRTAREHEAAPGDDPPAARSEKP